MKKGIFVRCPCWARLGLCLVCGSGCAPKLPGPCLQWLKPGESYQVMLGSKDPIGREFISIGQKSCGGDFDLQEGDSLKLDTEYQKRRSPMCDLIRITAVSMITNVTLGESGAVTPSAISPDLAAQFPDALIGKKCKGSYQIGINEMERVRAYRTFTASTVEECAAMDPNVTAGDPFCWDSWRVEVKDSKGVVVATSLE